MKKTLLLVLSFWILAGGKTGAAMDGDRSTGERLYQEGLRLFSLGEFPLAEGAFGQALDHALSPPHLPLRIEANLRLGDIHWILGKMEEARASYDEARRLSEGTSGRHLLEEAEARLRIHRLYSEGKKRREENEDSRSRECFEAAISTARRHRLPHHEIKALRQYSLHHWQAERWGEFHALNQQAYRLAVENHNSREQSACLNHIGIYFYKVNDLSEALKHLLRAFNISEKNRFLDLQNDVITNLSSVYIDLLQFDEAAAFIEKAIVLDARLGWPEQIPRDMNNLGIIKKKRGILLKNEPDIRKAIAIFQEAIVLSWESGDDITEYVLNNNLGEAHFAAGEYGRAIDRYRASRRGAVRFKDREMQCVLLNNLGKARLAADQIDGAAECFEEAIQMARDHLYERPLWEALDGLGQCREKKGDFDSAHQLYAASIEGIETSRKRIREDVNKVGYLRDKIGVYDNMISLIVNRMAAGHPQAQPRELFRYMEKAKAQAFLEGLSIVGGEPPSPAESPGARLGAAGEGSIQKTVEILDLEEIQGRCLSEGATALEFYLSEKVSTAMIITRHQVEVVSLPSLEPLEKSVRGYLKFLSMPRREYPECPAAVQALANRLNLGGLPGGGRDTRPLIIVPDGILHYFPFEVMRTGTDGGYLVQHYHVTYALSLSAYAAIQTGGRTGGTGLLAFGDPVYRRGREEGGNGSPGETLSPIPHSREEVGYAASKYPRDLRYVYCGKEARESVLKALQRTEYEIIHFACHGLIDEQKPMTSAIVLTRESGDEDGAVQVREWYQMKFRAELAILSACRTGIGSLERMEGMMGLPRVLLLSGARSVVSTLWRVDDRVTKIFVGSLYDSLEAGKTKSEALQDAKKKMLKSRYRDPYYWAGFILQGDGEAAISFRPSGPRSARETPPLRHE